MNEEKEQLLKDLSAALEYAKSVDSLQSRLSAIENDIFDLQNKKGNILFTIIAIVVSLVLYCPAMLIVTLLITPITGDWDYSLDYSPIITAILGIIIIVIAIIVDVSKNKKIKTKKSKRLPELYEEKRIDTQKLQQIMDLHKNKFNMFPQEYMIPFALEYFISVIRSGRADTMKEAMNMYEDQLHKWKMENLSEAHLIAQQEANAIAAVNAAANIVSAAANVSTSINTF